MKKLLLLIACLFSITAYGQLKGKAYLDSVYNAPERARWAKAAERDKAAQFQRNKEADELEDRRAQLAKEQNYNDSISKIETAKNDKENAEWFKKMNKKYGPDKIKKAMDGYFWIGMAEEIAWLPYGAATNVKTTTTANGKIETWYFYFSDITVCLKNHKIIAIND
jgi:hypothetical protein